MGIAKGKLAADKSTNTKWLTYKATWYQLYHETLNNSKKTLQFSEKKVRW